MAEGPVNKKQKTVPFSILMPDGSIRKVQVPMKEGLTAKQAESEAIDLLGKDDKKMLEGAERQLYRRSDKDDARDTLCNLIIELLNREKTDRIVFLEVDKETNRPVTRYIIKREKI